MVDLTRKELELLLEAVDLLEEKFKPDSSPVSSIFRSITDNAPEEIKKMFREFNMDEEASKYEKRDEAILLKAKLVTAKQNLVLDSANKILNKKEE